MKLRTKLSPLSSALAIAGVMFFSAGSVMANTVLTSGNGNVTLGVEDLGATGLSTGLSLAGVGDAITPGCYCEGWGAGYTGFSGYSANANGSANVSGVSFTTGVNTATSVVNITGSALQVTQTYGQAPGSGAMFIDHVTLTNTSAAAITDVRYSRATDWDIPPTEFDEWTTIQCWPATKLLFSNNNGFNAPNPFTDYSANCITGGTIASCADVTNKNFSAAGPADQGSFFTFGFGDLDAGASVSFDVLYGADYTKAETLTDLANAGAEIYVLGQSTTHNDAGALVPADGQPGTGVFAFGFVGVGGTPISDVPEPGTLALFGLALAGLVAARRKSA